MWFSSWGLFHGPKWLLEFQPSYLHSRKQERARSKTVHIRVYPFFWGAFQQILPDNFCLHLVDGFPQFKKKLEHAISRAHFAVQNMIELCYQGRRRSRYCISIKVFATVMIPTHTWKYKGKVAYSPFINTPTQEFLLSFPNPWRSGHVLLRTQSKLPQSCPTLCDPRDCSLPGSSDHGILQARILEWVAMPSCRGSSQPRDQTHLSCIAGGLFITSATWESGPHRRVLQ